MKRPEQGDSRGKAAAAGGDGSSGDIDGDAQFEAFLHFARTFDSADADTAFADAFRRILPVRLEQRRRKPKANAYALRMNRPER
ncbi:hypothetical protein H2509_02420 [Stappia sp. F7233]|uniref:Uncharacterized protein n=1 Tax=Stappia albiluteola TaxID=2758565 RepID=A0A839AAB2_9HYPH|nr:hypothetical protein [Stappia albiluteola]MBA5775978.1 hypothetical protein [Stappia albiluteola]